MIRAGRAKLDARSLQSTTTDISRRRYGVYDDLAASYGHRLVVPVTPVSVSRSSALSLIYANGDSV